MSDEPATPTREGIRLADEFVLIPDHDDTNTLSERELVGTHQGCPYGQEERINFFMDDESKSPRRFFLLCSCGLYVSCNQGRLPRTVGELRAHFRSHGHEAREATG